MNPEVLMYSSNDDITYSDLKNLNSEKFCVSVDDMQKTQEIFEKNGIKAIVMWEKDYHYKLNSIISAPYILHYIWDLSLLDREILGIVWPRKPTQYSFKVLQNLFEYAQNYDLATISGMAEWVDQLCHSFSVKYKIPTIAVLWWWIYHYLKWPSRYIIDTIVQSWWLVLSEFKIWFKPTKYSFPQRNRIVAWLCDKLFLPEAWDSSGSLITADFAFQQNKPIFATPNDIFSETSLGIHQLISDQKAKIVVSLENFLKDNFKKNGKIFEKKIENIPPEQSEILTALHSKWALDLANLIKETHLDANQIMTNITMLEINNIVYQNTPWYYSICIE